MTNKASRGRSTPRAQRSNSGLSDSSYAPHTTPPPSTRHNGAGTQAVRANSIESETPAPPNASLRTTRLPSHYSLPPTVPSPFAGTLESSLDAILVWATKYSGTQTIVNTLLQPVDKATNWPLLLQTLYLSHQPTQPSRFVLEDILFLATRRLLPEQVAENRGLMARLYDRKKQLAIRLVLRYDMLREWKMDSAWHPVAVASLPAPEVPGVEYVASQKTGWYGRRALMPNVISTLIAAPPGGWTTHAVRERMRHHVTDLDNYLLLSDEEVASWSTETLLSMTSQILLVWQWLRQSNEILEDMEVHGYEELDGKADECEWIADDLKRPEWGRIHGRGKSAAVEAGLGL